MSLTHQSHLGVQRIRRRCTEVELRVADRLRMDGFPMSVGIGWRAIKQVSCRPGLVLILSDHLASSLRHSSSHFFLIRSILQYETTRHYGFAGQHQPVKPTSCSHCWLRIRRHLCRRQPPRILTGQSSPERLPWARLQRSP